MSISIGGPPRPDFDDPLGLMQSCHRRVERFLGALVWLTAGEGADGALDRSRRDALAGALRYFSESGPRHTADEEQSLHPRLRANRDPAIRALLPRLEALEAEHRDAEALHDEVDRLGRRWLARGSLEPADAGRLAEAVRSLAAVYPAHIRFEDEAVFPAARAALSEAEIAEMGRELAARRGVDLEGRWG